MKIKLFISTDGVLEKQVNDFISNKDIEVQDFRMSACDKSNEEKTPHK
jgi:hypothetical protein